MDAIPCREIGYILRSLGQNPTENEIIALVCEAGCDWEGYLTRSVGSRSVRGTRMKEHYDLMSDATK